MRADLHVPPVRDGADAGEEEGGDDDLVQDAAHQTEVRPGVGGEDAGRVRRGAPGAPVVFVPDQRVPVDTEHRGRAQEGSQVLAGQIVGNFSPGKLAHTEMKYCRLRTQRG